MVRRVRGRRHAKTIQHTHSFPTSNSEELPPPNSGKNEDKERGIYITCGKIAFGIFTCSKDDLRRKREQFTYTNVTSRSRCLWYEKHTEQDVGQSLGRESILQKGGFFVRGRAAHGFRLDLIGQAVSMLLEHFIMGSTRT